MEEDEILDYENLFSFTLKRSRVNTPKTGKVQQGLKSNKASKNRSSTVCRNLFSSPIVLLNKEKLVVDKGDRLTNLGQNNVSHSDSNRNTENHLTRDNEDNEFVHRNSKGRFVKKSLASVGKSGSPPKKISKPITIPESVEENHSLDSDKKIKGKELVRTVKRSEKRKLQVSKTAEFNKRKNHPSSEKHNSSRCEITEDESKERRCSQRTRFPVMDSWRNQRIIYKLDGPAYRAVGINQGTTIDDGKRDSSATKDRSKSAAPNKSPGKVTKDKLKSPSPSKSLGKTVAVRSAAKAKLRSPSPSKSSGFHKSKNKVVSAAKAKLRSPSPSKLSVISTTKIERKSPKTSKSTGATTCIHNYTSQPSSRDIDFHDNIFSHQNYSYTKPTEVPYNTVSVAKPIQNDKFSVGFLVLEANKEKGFRFLVGDTLVYIVQLGEVKVTLEDVTQILREKDAFIVQPDSSYNIYNLCNHDAELIFFQLKQ